MPGATGDFIYRQQQSRNACDLGDGCLRCVRAGGAEVGSKRGIVTGRPKRNVRNPMKGRCVFMPCMCGDSQCPSCGSAQDTLELCDGGCSLWDCARPKGHSGPCQPKDDPEGWDRELWQQIDNLGKNTDTLKRLGTAFERMFRAEGLGPRGKMRRWKDER